MRCIHPSPPSIPSPPAVTQPWQPQNGRNVFFMTGFSRMSLNNEVACSTKLECTSPWRPFSGEDLLSTSPVRPTIRQTSLSPQSLKVNAICLTANHIARGHAECVCVCMCLPMCVCMRNTLMYTLRGLLKGSSTVTSATVKLGFTAILQIIYPSDKLHFKIKAHTVYLMPLSFFLFSSVAFRAVTCNCLVTTPLWG